MAKRTPIQYPSDLAKKVAKALFQDIGRGDAYHKACEKVGIPTHSNDLPIKGYKPTAEQDAGLIAAAIKYGVLGFELDTEDIVPLVTEADPEFEALLAEEEAIEAATKLPQVHGFPVGQQVVHCTAAGDLQLGVVKDTGPEGKVVVEIDGEAVNCRPKSLQAMGAPPEPDTDYIVPQNEGQRYAAYLLHPESKRASEAGAIAMLTAPAMTLEEAKAAVSCWKAKGVQKP